VFWFRGVRFRPRIRQSELTHRPRGVVLRHEFNLWAGDDAGGGGGGVPTDHRGGGTTGMALRPDERVLQTGASL